MRGGRRGAPAQGSHRASDWGISFLKSRGAGVSHHKEGFPGGLWCSVLLCLFTEHRNPSVSILTYDSMQIKLRPACFNNGLKIQRHWWALILTLILIYCLTERLIKGLLWILFLFDDLENYWLKTDDTHTHIHIQAHKMIYKHTPYKIMFYFNIMKWKHYEEKWSWKKINLFSQWKYLIMFLQKKKETSIFWQSSETL